MEAASGYSIHSNGGCLRFASPSFRPERNIAVIGTDTARVTIARPQRADARRNFDALLAAARTEFAENGAGASLEEIARTAGVGIGTLYRNFPTRDALVEAVYVDEVDAVVRAAEDAAGLEDPWAAVQAWLRRFIVYIGTKKALLEGLNKESPVLMSCRASLYHAGGPLVQRAQEAGELREDASIDDVIRMISGIAGVAFDDDEQRDRVIAMAIDGLRAR